jgi:hypothetical protein
MMHTREYIKALLTISAIIPAIFSQAATISGHLIDASDKSSLPEATVKLVTATRDSTMLKGITTDEDGNFWLTDVDAGKYVIQLSYVGYHSGRRTVTIGKDGADVKLGDIALKASSIMLKETTVTGVKTEIKVKEDTVEYNADSYKTQPNAVVEDLLKRLPGVQVSSDGKITANGKEVSKILLNGKEFFADDPKVATKNLPSNIVDKVQVVDRKSDLARLTGVDDGEDETVINLSVKKGMDNGWLGNISTGYGTDNRYEASAMLNRFWNGNQLTILGGGNNTNNLGFTDGGAQRFQRFGGTNGINKSQTAGINFNIGNGEIFRVGGSVMYSHSDRDTRTLSNRQYLFTDSTSWYKDNSIARDRGHNVRGDFRMRWQIDSLNTLEFRPNFSMNFNKSDKMDTSVTIAGDPMQSIINRSQTAYNSDGSSYEFGGELVFNHNFKSHPGRSYSAQGRYKLSNVHENGTTYTKNAYYFVPDKNELINQVYKNHRWSDDYSGRLTWTEPLGNVKNGRFLTLSYTGEFERSNADKLVYDLPGSTNNPDDRNGAGGTNNSSITSTAAYEVTSSLFSDDLVKYITNEYSSDVFTNPTLLSQILKVEIGPNDVLNTNQSDKFRNDYFNESMQIGFKQVRKQYNLDVGFSVNSAMSKSDDLMNDARTIPSHWVWNVAPYARLRYKFSKTRNLAFNYRARSSQPSLTQLQPVADVSNPLRVVVGNPDLKPTFTQRFNLRYSDFNQDAQRSIMGMINGQFASNSIISTTNYNQQTGGQVTTYANVGGVWNVSGMGMISFPLRNKSFYLSSNANAMYSSTVGYNNNQYNRSGSLTLSIAPGIAYRTDYVDIELRPSYTFQTTHNTVQSSANQTIHTYGGMLFGNYYTPFGLVLNSDLTFSGTSGYSEGYNVNQWLWNASISYQFLKGKSASLTAKVYDILHQKKNISRNVTANYIEDVSYNSLTRYVMFTFTYKFNTFGSNKDIPKNNYDGFGHHGGGFHGGPPM